MYAGSTLVALKYFDAWFGAHQKIDRISRKHLNLLFPETPFFFPSSRDIMKFEGLDGPDGIKRKTPAKDEPWHFFDPSNPDDIQILQTIQDHHRNLVDALRSRNKARAAFEAAWLAHAIVDGLTPAHHYPYEEELVKLRGGAGLDTRTSAKEKIVIPGDTIPKQISNNWKMWGDKGLLATHITFEWGIAAIIAPLRLSRAIPDTSDLEEMSELGFSKLYRQRGQEIMDLHMYDAFYKSNWNLKLVKQVRKQLAPTIINTVTLAWYAAIKESQSHK